MKRGQRARAGRAGPAQRGAVLRDLALRGAEAAAEERTRHAEAIEFLRKVNSGEIELDLDAARRAHEEREFESVRI